MSNRWILIRNRALELEALGVPYNQGFQMAQSEIPENDPRVVSSSATVANEAALRQRRAAASEHKARAANLTKRSLGCAWTRPLILAILARVFSPICWTASACISPRESKAAAPAPW